MTKKEPKPKKKEPCFKCLDKGYIHNWYPPQKCTCGISMPANIRESERKKKSGGLHVQDY